MKKIIATALCLTIASPCFAMGRFDCQYPDHGFDNGRGPHYEARYDHHNDLHMRKHHRTSDRTKVLGAAAGIAGVALVISAIMD